MPTYQYRCTECGRELEIVQKFSDPSLTVCPNCSGELRKIFNAVGVVFKGSGFYRTDSRDAGNKRAGSDLGKSDGHKGEPATSSSGDGAAKGKDSGSTSTGSTNGSNGSSGSANGSADKKPAAAGKAAASA